jgi:hypothetical protein
MGGLHHAEEPPRHAGDPDRDALRAQRDPGHDHFDAGGRRRPPDQALHAAETDRDRRAPPRAEASLARSAGGAGALSPAEPPLRLGDAASLASGRGGRPAGPPARPSAHGRHLRGRREVQPRRGHLRMGTFDDLVRETAGTLKRLVGTLFPRRTSSRSAARPARSSTFSRGSRRGRRRPPARSERRARRRRRCARHSTRNSAIAPPQADRRVGRARGHPSERADADGAGRVPGAAHGGRSGDPPARRNARGRCGAPSGRSSNAER